MSGKTRLLGLDCDDLCLQEVIEALMTRRPDENFTYVVMPDADHFARLRQIPVLSIVFEAAYFCLLDSNLLSLFAGALKLPCPPVVTGADLASGLLARLDGERVAVIGLARPDFWALRADYPKIIFLHHLPPTGLLDDPIGFRRALDFAVRAQSRFTFIALGSPVQELLAYTIMARRNASGIGLCIGAALQSAGGFGHRAPGWMRGAGLEWLHRFGRKPLRRARRYLPTDPVVLISLVAEAIRRRMA